MHISQVAEDKNKQSDGKSREKIINHAYNRMKNIYDNLD